VRLARVGETHDHDQQTARQERQSHARDQAALEIITGQNQLKGLRRKIELASFEVREPRVNGRVFPTQQFDRGRRTIHRGDAPATFCQVEGIATRPTGKIERRAGSQRLSKFNH
jgi:hypothetical protein